MQNLSLIKIVFIGVYSDPSAPGGNNLLWKQAKTLLEFGYEIDIITWPHTSFWKGKYPNALDEQFCGIPYLYYKRRGVKYHIIKPPEFWGNDVPDANSWNDSIAWAKELLLKLKPDIVHQHYWKKMWFFMQAAVDLSIPLIYSVYDWGLPCRRQNLIMGNGSLCHLKPSIENCTFCCADSDQAILPHSRNSIPVIISNEIEKLLERWEALSMKLSGLIVTSPFARNFYHSLGINNKIIYEMPWFYGQSIKKKRTQPSDPKSNIIRLGFLGRIVPEKGLHIIFDSLRLLKPSTTYCLNIAGAINNSYARELKDQNVNDFKLSNINWLGWVSNEKLGRFFNEIDVLIVPSLWFDNSPTVIVESLAHNCPVICSDILSMTHLITHNKNGLLFKFSNAADLAIKIENFIDNKALRIELKANAMFKISPADYCHFLLSVYNKTLSQH